MFVWKSGPTDHVEAWLEDHGFEPQPKRDWPGYFVTVHRVGKGGPIVDGMVRVFYRGDGVNNHNGWGFIKKQLKKVAKALGKQGIAVELSPDGFGYPHLIVPLSDALWKEAAQKTA